MASVSRIRLASGCVTSAMAKMIALRMPAAGYDQAACADENNEQATQTTGNASAGMHEKRDRDDVRYQLGYN
jgi:hypothetical protein